jgi:hypothetical protein
MTLNAGPIKLGTSDWRAMIDHRLKMGFGVEDIAIMLACDVRYVRTYVNGLRGRGKLAEWWPSNAG